MPAQQPAPQANTAARPTRTPALAGAGLSSVGVLTIALTGAPWPMVLTLALTGLLVVLIQSAFQAFLPQDSQHRLAWWRHYWNHRATRRRNRSSTPDTPPPAP
ncbi:hypothetical protein J8N05_46730 (plasmid) [Streptomyces sp. BH-SS-21]|uniref:Uncharacterized protein n=1 Tax=Streptomyces liliiviolaceus TaxID=2823109 RepID=A0A941BEV9_9ACTN|nr:hypothetical protein [Streptomyces liliiviolaceus]MBQ0855658.1 hypothetical protein [Streptomyces liliiviolaceus]